MALGLTPKRALLNDINPHLINFYRWLQRGFEVDFSPQNDKEEFYCRRTRFNTLIEGGGTYGREAASLFYYLNRTGYNGLCRFNGAGAFNVPFGRYVHIRYQTDFLRYQEVLAPWTFGCDDFARVPIDDADFVYADPPYDVSFTQYAKNGFAWHDQERLVEWLSKHPGPIVLVNQATDRVLRLYRDSGYAIRLLSAPRQINSSGDRTPAIEIVATRNV